MIKKLILSNIGIKLLSLCLAIILWVYVTEELFIEVIISNVQLEFINLPSKLYISKKKFRRVKMILKGSKKNIEKIEDKIKIIVNLQNAQPGINIYSISNKNVIGIKKTKIISIAPEELILEIKER